MFSNYNLYGLLVFFFITILLEIKLLFFIELFSFTSCVIIDKFMRYLSFQIYYSLIILGIDSLVYLIIIKFNGVGFFFFQLKTNAKFALHHAMSCSSKLINQDVVLLFEALIFILSIY